MAPSDFVSITDGIISTYVQCMIYSLLVNETDLFLFFLILHDILCDIICLLISILRYTVSPNVAIEKVVFKSYCGEGPSFLKFLLVFLSIPLHAGTARQNHPQPLP